MAPKTRMRVYVGVGIAAAFVLIFVGFIWFPVCDDQLTDGGEVVNICRHVATTDPPVVVLGVLVLVMLSSFYVEISAFGVTLKGRVAELEQRSEKTERKADDLQVKAEDLQVTVGDLADFNREQVVPQVLSPQLTAASPERVPDPRVVDLVNEYNTLRWTMPSGHDRTKKMTDMVAQLQAALCDTANFDVTAHLAHTDRGVRLAAFAYLQTHPSTDLTSTIVDMAATEDKPFGQCSALRAALHQVAVGGRLTEHDRGTLHELRDRIGHRNDRAHLIRKLLGES